MNKFIVLTYRHEFYEGCDFPSVMDNKIFNNLEEAKEAIKKANNGILPKEGDKNTFLVSDKFYGDYFEIVELSE